MGNTLESVIFDVLENCGRTKGAVATDMGIPLSTLSRETSPYDSGAKFGAAALIPFMRATSSEAPLEFIADAMDKRIVPKKANPDGEDMRHETLQAWDAASDFLRAANDPSVSYQRLLALRNRVAKEMDDVLERRNPNYQDVAPKGYIAGQIVTPGGFQSILPPDEDVGRNQ